MTAVRRQGDGILIGDNGPRGGLEFAIEEIVEALVALHRIGELGDIDTIFLDEGCDLRGAGRRVHA